MASAARLLRLQWERSCERLLRRLEGLTDAEYRWEPVPNCWNVRSDPTSPSGWTVDYPEVPPPPPPPVTTIAWRLLHIADGNTIYWEHAFGPGVRNFGDLAPHGDAAGAIEYLEESQRLVTATLAELDDARLDEMRPTHFGVDWPARRVLAVLLDEQVHHGAEVGLLRDSSPRPGRREGVTAVALGSGFGLGGESAEVTLQEGDGAGGRVAGRARSEERGVAGAGVVMRRDGVGSLLRVLERHQLAVGDPRVVRESEQEYGPLRPPGVWRYPESATIALTRGSSPESTRMAPSDMPTTAIASASAPSSPTATSRSVMYDGRSFAKVACVPSGSPEHGRNTPGGEPGAASR